MAHLFAAHGKGMSDEGHSEPWKALLVLSKLRNQQSVRWCWDPFNNISGPAVKVKHKWAMPTI